jgi:hypothetical protein
MARRVTSADARPRLAVAPVAVADDARKDTTNASETKSKPRPQLHAPVHVDHALPSLRTASAGLRSSSPPAQRQGDSGQAGGPNAARSLTPEHPARVQRRSRRTFCLDADSDLSA